MSDISVIIPLALQDQSYLPDLLTALAKQTVQPREILVAATADPLPIVGTLPIRFIPNPSGTISTALNLSIEATTAPLIVRFDVRARPWPDHLEKLLARLTLTEDGIFPEVVGGRLQIVPGKPGLVAEAIALAVSHPWGAGDAHYRLSAQGVREVDTVPYAGMRRAVWQRLGGYNESLLVNEDYEFLWRVRRAGGHVQLDPDIVTRYTARTSLLDLARQYFRYGWWKIQMLRQHPRSIRWRQWLPIAALGLGGLAVLSSVALQRGWVVGVLVGIYFLVTVAVSWRIAWAQRAPRLVFALPLAFGVVHLGWSLGAWINLLTVGHWPRR